MYDMTLCGLSVHVCLQCLFPNALKVVKVLQVVKSVRKMAISNYHPVSCQTLLSTSSQRLINTGIHCYTVQYSCLSDKQFVFTEQRSTSMGILRLVDDIAGEVQKCNLTTGVFTDLSTAFDTVERNIVIDNVFTYGITGSFLE